MSQAKKIKVRSRLSMLAFAGGGITVRDAVRKGDEAINSLRGACLDAIDGALNLMDSRFGPANPKRDEEPIDDLYGLSSGIIDVAGAVRDTGIDQAAKALCDLVDLSSELEVWDWEAVDVHLSTLRLLRTRGDKMKEAERAAVIEGLIKVTRKRVGDPKDLPVRDAG